MIRKREVQSVGGSELIVLWQGHVPWRVGSRSLDTAYAVKEAGASILRAEPSSPGPRLTASRA